MPRSLRTSLMVQGVTIGNPAGSGGSRIVRCNVGAGGSPARHTLEVRWTCVM
jgi:hypothetical protein